MNGRLTAIGAALCAMTAACADGGDAASGLGPAAPGAGPRIVFDVFAPDVPDIPLPNDIALRVDFGSPTGFRVNASMFAPTRLESDVRRRLNELDGFGTFGPITVQFTETLDIQNILDRHADADFSDDVAYVVNIDPASPKFGQATMLDLGRGNYPTRLRENARNQYFQLDPRGDTTSIAFNTVAEDVNENGVLDPGEDTDFDGELGVPNILRDRATGEVCRASTMDEPACDPDRRLLEFYELRTNTLILRPLVALEQQSRYAVILTKRLTGYDGQPVRSPFATIAHARQADALSVLPEILPGLGLGMADVAFAWTFATQSVTRDLEALRRGIDGEGPFAWLREEYPARLSGLIDWGDPEALGGPHGSPYVLEQDAFLDFFGVFGLLQLAGLAGFEDMLEAMAAFVDGYRSVAYMVGGSFRTPYFLDPPDETFRMDFRTGAAEIGEDEATFLLAIPKETDVCKPPFRIAFVGHGSAGSKLDSLGFAGSLARHCLAVIGLDAAAHAPHRSIEQLLRDPRRFFGRGASLDESIRGFVERLIGVSDPLVLDVVVALLKFGIADAAFPMVAPESGYGSPAELAALSMDDLFEEIAKLPLADRLLGGGRAEDIDGDGFRDSGAKFWTANMFRTRDQVRQTVVDYIQLIEILQGFDGVRLWDFDVNRNGLADDLAGDFDGDGRVDVGGPEAPYYTMGLSLGAFFSAILPAVEPAVRAAAPVSTGAGLTDIAVRSVQPGVVEAVFLELMGPLLVGGPGDQVGGRLAYDLVPDAEKPAVCDGVGPDLYSVCGAVPAPLDPARRYIAWDVGVGDAQRVFPVAPLDALEEGDRIEVRNLANGERGTFVAGPQGTFRVPIASDVGDPILITVTDGETGAVKFTESTPALTKGYGFKRGSTDMRRMVGIAQTILEAGDPANYAPHMFLDPLPGMSPKNVLSISTVGDMNVPMSTGVAYARALGALDYLAPNPARGGRTDNEALIDVGAVGATYQTSPFLATFDGELQPVLFDAADFDEGADALADPKVPGFADLSPPQPPLRPRVLSKRPGEPDSAAAGVSGMSLPYILPRGMHAFIVRSPYKTFDIETFMINQIGWYFLTGGKEIVDDPCLADDSCPYLFNRAPE